MDMMSLLTSLDCDRQSNDPDEDADQSGDLNSHEFNKQLHLHTSNDDDSSSHQLSQKDSEDVDVEEDNIDHDKEDDDDDFTFMFIGDNDDDEDHDNIYDDKEVFEDGKIRPVFPLFDQNLLVEYDIEEINTLPILPPVDKIFIESPRGFPTNSREQQPNNDAATGPFCTWSKDADLNINKKSNSTGFSKLWRLKEKVGRSNSDGRDAFVFLKSSSDKSTATTSSSSSSSNNNNNNGGTFVKVNVAGGQAKVVKKQLQGGTKAKKPTVISAHEVYLRNKAAGKVHTEEDRRRSYLPYRPELMGIFTNAHVGFSKNLHPY